MKKLPKLSKLVKDLDTIFSIYIRKRDSDDTGYGRCVTCNRIGLWKEMDNGHFVSRAERSVRWDEKNCAMQCKRCNGFRGGEQYLFAQAIDKRYGEGTAESLQSKRHQPSNIGRVEMMDMIEYYKNLLTM